METKYPTLRRPKRKLCYLTDKESPSKQWAGTLTLGDVDKMFDDLDPSSHDDGDIPSPSPLLQTFDIETNRSERESRPVPQEAHLAEKPRCQVVMKQSVVTVTSTDNNKGPEGDVPDAATRSSSPKLEIDLDVPFKAHGPVKTSSPIEEDIVVEGVEELDNETGSIVSPILFPCDDEGKEEAKTEPSPTQTPQCNGHAAEKSDVSEFESPPSKIALSAPKMSSQKNKGEGSCNKNYPVKENAPKKSQTPVLDGKIKAPSQENTDPSVSAVRQEPEVAALKKKPESVHRQPSLEVSTRVGKDMTTFLQKLRDAGKPNPARKSLSPVRAPTPPEPEDDFLILEDDTPLWFSIPSKTASTKRRSIASSTDKDSSTDKGSKDNVLETAQQQQESEQENDKPRSQTVNQKTKRRKGKEKKNEVTEPGNDLHELSSPEDLPAGDLMEEKPDKKKRRLKKAPSKESDMEEEQPKDTASSQTDEERPTLKMEKKAQKSSEMKRSKSSKDGIKKDKTSRATSSKEARELTDAEDLVPLTDKEIVNSVAQTGEKEQIKLPIVSEESSSDNSQILGKRKRRPTGNWWLSCRQSAEETKVTENQPTVKKSKQNNKEPSAAAASPVKTKKDRVSKQKKQTQPASSSSQNTNKGKEKKTRRNRNRNTRGDTPDKMKASEEAFDVLETEQIDEQQPEVPDQDLDPVQSSPLVHKDHSLNSGKGDQVFQRVYHHVSNKKMPITPPPASPRRPREQLSAAERGKRRRKAPSNWWTVNSLSEDVESISSQPQQLEPKPRKERKKQSKQSRSPGLGTPKTGNVAVSSTPLGGAPVPPLKVNPLSTPKTVKRSLATFKDIFSSVTESPTVVRNREAGQNNKCKVTARPVVEVSVTDCTALNKTNEHILSMDDGESNSPPNQEPPQDSKCHSENTLKAFRSGPSSMIELEQYEEYEDMSLPSSRVHTVLSTADLCAPPLKPLILQPKDKANMAEWFRSLWSTTVDNSPVITPDQFDWYFYQGRAIGFQVDLECGSVCNGKILLGSYMKKPLWVDHSATTVFNLLTSSVSVTIDVSESSVYPGQSFMVPCGHAYSIQNNSAQPAVLYFTRVLTESSD